MSDDTPIRLADACRYFPAGALTPSALRRERDRGNLTTFLIAGKEGRATYEPKVVLPKPSRPRERWLTRNEVARLLWAAYRNR